MNCIYNVSPNLKVVELRQEPVMINITNIDEETATEFREAMSMAHNSGQDVIPIIIDSYGGNAHSLLSMIDTIQDSKRKVATIVVGKALGSAAILAAMGNKGLRFISPYASMMLNNVSKESWGKTDAFKADTREVERLYKFVCQLMDQNCDKEIGYFENLIKDKGGSDWYLEPMDAVDFGLIDHVRSPWLEVDINPVYSFDGVIYKENLDEID
jgi:ATP-dependent protease ClpP protease subunit